MVKSRSGFVSNSSSSSFIITKPQNIKEVINIINNYGCYDYYELEDKLYTSFISDGSNIYVDLCKLAEDSIDGSHGQPYELSEFVEFEGDRGVDSVYIQKFRCKDVMKAENKIKDDLYKYVYNYINYNSIFSDECIHQDDIILEDSPYFLQRCCEIVGYYEREEWEK